MPTAMLTIGKIMAVKVDEFNKRGIRRCRIDIYVVFLMKCETAPRL